MPDDPPLPGRSRLQKYLADAGLGARRKCEQLILDGRITVNGAVAVLGMSVTSADDVRLDGKPIARGEKLVYIALNKPRGYASDLGDTRNKSVFELVRSPERLHAIGRLDMDSRGLLLLTNDGELSFKLTHPRFEHEKEYHVWVRGQPGPAVLKKWRGGVMLENEDTPTLPCEVRIMGSQGIDTQLSVVLREGRRRQIRRVAKLLGFPVLDLVRVRIGPQQLGGLESGRWRHLTSDEVDALRRSV